jgi:hypothetical protein
MKPIYAVPVRALALTMTLYGCGQDPSFVEASITEGSLASEAASQDAVAADGEVGVEDFSIPSAGDSESAPVMPDNPISSIVATRPEVAVVATPVVATPVVATPVVATPVVATPVVATPVVATPVVATPVVPTTPSASPAVPVVVQPKPPVAPVVTPSPTQPLPTTPPAPAQPAFPSQPSNPSSPVFTIPGLTPSEQVQVAQCITKWGKVPFTGTFTNVRRIKAAVSVYGIGSVINDVTQTAQPMLVLIDAGVNVMGNPTYNLLNNNGYYCMKVNVNVKTDFDINLACNAKLADNSVQVNVASDVNSETSVIGVNVGSNVQVTRMTASRGECAY